MYELTINKSVFNEYNLTQTHLHFKRRDRRDKFSWQSYEEKLDNSISRARSNFMNICNYNHFYYFYTQTISSSLVRNDLKVLQKKFNNIIKRLKKLYPGKTFQYIYIPELHSDNKNIHIHGFLTEDFKILKYINKNGFPSLKYFDKIGFNSVEAIRNNVSSAIYMSKYITKDLLSLFKKGDRIYYCSKGLKRENVIHRFTLSQIAPCHFDFKNDFCFKTTLSKERYLQMLTKLRNENLNYWY